MKASTMTVIWALSLMVASYILDFNTNITEVMYGIVMQFPILAFVIVRAIEESKE